MSCSLDNLRDSSSFGWLSEQSGCSDLSGGGFKTAVPPIKLAQNFRDAKVTRSGIGRLVQRERLTKRRLHFINARGFGALAFGRQTAEGRLDRRGVNLVQLLDVGNDLSHLRRKDAALFVSDFQMRKLRDLFDVSFGNGHGEYFRFAISVLRLKVDSDFGDNLAVAQLAARDAILSRA